MYLVEYVQKFYSMSCDFYPEQWVCAGQIREEKLFLWVRLPSFSCSIKKRSMQNLKNPCVLPKHYHFYSFKFRKNDSRAFLIKDCSKQSGAWFTLMNQDTREATKKPLTWYSVFPRSILQSGWLRFPLCPWRLAAGGAACREGAAMGVAEWSHLCSLGQLRRSGSGAQHDLPLLQWCVSPVRPRSVHLASYLLMSSRAGWLDKMITS